MTKAFLKLLTFILLTFSLTSCDPSHEIFFTNKTASNVKVKINLKPEPNYYFQQIAVKDSIVFHLPKDSVAQISFGIGNWSQKEIATAVNSIKTIEVETSDIKTIYKSKKAIQSVFEENVHGAVFKSLIEINIE